MANPLATLWMSGRAAQSKLLEVTSFSQVRGKCTIISLRDFVGLLCVPKPTPAVRTQWGLLSATSRTMFGVHPGREGE